MEWCGIRRGFLFFIFIFTSSSSSSTSDRSRFNGNIHRVRLRSRGSIPYEVIIKDDHPARSFQSTKPSWFWELAGRHDDPAARASKIYCSGDLLDAVQLSGIFEDSKEFVDMPMRYDPEIILDAFQQLSPETRKNATLLYDFIGQHFSPPGADLIPLNLTDFHEHASVLENLTPNSSYYNWAIALNFNWEQLLRRVSDDVFANPQRYSLLRRRFPIVIPGGRFRESYYWDSYWIVLGLLACDMKETAKGLIHNLLDDVANFGFVPNGGRIYYLNRSQPPLLSEMILALLEADDALRKDSTFVSMALSALETEYQYWMQDGKHAVKLRDQDGKEHVLNRYWTQATYPRPESYKEDVFSSLGAPVTTNLYGGIFANIAAGAESGWDFSSRWIVPGLNGTYNLSDIDILSIVPVDLNSFMYRMERNLARLHEFKSGQNQTVLLPLNYTADHPLSSSQAVNYTQAADRRALAMDVLMWNEESGSWMDYIIPTQLGDHRLRVPGQGVVSVSSFLPMWSNVLANSMTSNRSAKAVKVLRAFKGSGLIQVGGVQSTLLDTGEQWDSPNAWAPVQHMIIEGLESLNLSDSSDLAQDLAKKWLQSNYLGYINTGAMYEKYNALLPGARGEGGEYYPQIGFGWTNGVVLHLLKTYGTRWRLDEGKATIPSSSSSPPSKDFGDGRVDAKGMQEYKEEISNVMYKRERLRFATPFK